MFDKIVTAIKFARAGARTFGDFQQKLEAIKAADANLDGHPDIENLKTVGLAMRDTCKILLAQGKEAFILVKGLIESARKA